ncbi:MAG: hypothetical protein R2838_23295 [Caldilineaceae bacterium]
MKAANPLSVRTGDVLYVGERLVIPSAAGEAAADAEGHSHPDRHPGAGLGRQHRRRRWCRRANSPASPRRRPHSRPGASATRSQQPMPPLPTEEAAVEEPAAEERPQKSRAAGPPERLDQQTYVVQAGSREQHCRQARHLRPRRCATRQSRP